MAQRQAKGACAAPHTQADFLEKSFSFGLVFAMPGRSRGSLYVKPLGETVREVDIRERFSPFGEIKDIYRPMHRGSGRVRRRDAQCRRAGRGRLLHSFRLVLHLLALSLAPPQQSNYCYVEYVETADAEKAMAGVDGTEFHG